MLHYAEEHPGEVVDAQEALSQREIARWIREEASLRHAMRSPRRYRPTTAELASSRAADTATLHNLDHRFSAAALHEPYRFAELAERRPVLLLVLSGDLAHQLAPLPLRFLKTQGHAAAILQVFSAFGKLRREIALA